SSKNVSPGLSSVPASIDPIMTLVAPAARAFTASPEYLIPPSAMTGTSPAPSTASSTAVSCGTPTPVTTRVVQIDPGPTPTFTASTPRSTSASAASRVRILTALVNVLDRDETFEGAGFVHNGQLLDAMLAEDAFGFVKRGAFACCNEVLRRHRFTQRTIEVALELEVAVRDDADEQIFFV